MQRSFFVEIFYCLRSFSYLLLQARNGTFKLLKWMRLSVRNSEYDTHLYNVSLVWIPILKATSLLPLRGRGHLTWAPRIVSCMGKEGQGNLELQGPFLFYNGIQGIFRSTSCFTRYGACCWRWLRGKDSELRCTQAWRNGICMGTLWVAGIKYMCVLEFTKNLTWIDFNHYKWQKIQGRTDTTEKCR